MPELTTAQTDANLTMTIAEIDPIGFGCRASVVGVGGWGEANWPPGRGKKTRWRIFPRFRWPTGSPYGFDIYLLIDAL
jgi:hypothetical protein